MKPRLIHLIKNSGWASWVGLSLAMHLLAALAVAALGQPPLVVTLEEAPQSPRMQVTFVEPPRPTTTAPPPTQQARSAEVIATQKTVERRVPKVKKPVPSPEAPDPPPRNSANQTATAQRTTEDNPPAKKPEPEIRPEPKSAPLPEKPAPTPKRVEHDAPTLSLPSATTQNPQEPPSASASAEQLEGGELRKMGPNAIVNPAPTYPRAAVARGWTGTVWLEVEVCRSGRPQYCAVIESSGYAHLDRQARRQVLKAWRFQPGGHDGRVAIVSVAFSLR